MIFTGKSMVSCRFFLFCQPIEPISLQVTLAFLSSPLFDQPEITLCCFCARLAVRVLGFVTDTLQQTNTAMYNRNIEDVNQLQMRHFQEGKYSLWYICTTMAILNDFILPRGLYIYIYIQLDSTGRNIWVHHGLSMFTSI